MSVKSYFKNNGNIAWYFVVDIQKNPRKQHRVRGFGTKKEAQQAEREYILNYKDRGCKLNPDKTTVSQIFDIFFQHIETSSEYAKGTVNNYKGYRNNHLSEFEHKRLNELVPLIIQDWVDKMSITSSPYVINGCRKLLNASFNYAIKQHLISDNPFKDMSKATEPIVIRNRFDVNGYLRMYEACKEHMPNYFCLFAVASLDGMRIGEYTALCVEDIDFELGKIYVNKQYTRRELKKKTKTTYSTRSVDMAPVLAEVIKWHMKTYNITTGFLFTEKYKDKPISPECVNGRFDKLLELCGYNKNFMRVHDLRGQYIDLGHRLGLPTVYLSRQVGHARTSTTTDIYSQILNDVGEEAKLKISSLFCDQIVTNGT